MLASLVRNGGRSLSQPPVIDVGNLPDDSAALAAIDDACVSWGCFHVTGHGIDADLCATALEQARVFFALPAAAKRSVIRSDVNVWGFYDRELTKNARDWKEIFDVGPAEHDGPVAGAMPQWPDGKPEFRAVLESFTDKARKLGRRLIAAIGRNLGAAPGSLERAFEPRDSSFLRLNYYPVADDAAPPDAPTIPPTGQLGIHHHTDAGALTVLLQDEHAGLQVLNRDRWVLIDPVPDALTVNIGDIVQVWSNDRYRAPLHRVIVSSDVPRFSVPFFFNPAYATDYAPLPSVIGRTGAARYRPINWGEFRSARAAGDYADYGQEIQISDFLLDDAASSPATGTS